MCPVTRSITCTVAAAFVAFLLVGPLLTASGFTVVKCCPKNQAFVNRKINCTRTNETEDDKFKVPKIVNESGAFDFYSEDQYIIRYGMPKCEDVVRMLPKNDSDESFNITDKGYIQSMIRTFPSDKFDYCFEKFFSDGNFYYKSILCNIKAPCGEEDPRDHCPCIPGHYVANKCPGPASLVTFLYIYVVIISLPFLLLTFIVYAVFKELRYLHTKCVMFYTANLFVTYITYIYTQYYTLRITEKNTHCIYLAYFQQFLLLSSFSWMCVICFNFWREMYALTLRSSSKRKEIIKLIKYATCAWGYSILVTAITYISEQHFFFSLLPDPNIGNNDKCWIASKSAQMMYFYFPAAIPLVANSLMVIHIMKIIFKVNANTEGSFVDKGFQNHKYTKLKICIKLSMIMGINWTIGIVLDSLTLFNITNGEDIITIGFGLRNALQGVFIFVIFICDKSTLRLIYNRCCSTFTNESLEILRKKTNLRTTSEAERKI